MSEKSFKIVGDDISDGYHTFSELYEHRCALFVALCLAQPEKCAWKHDYPGWLCLYLETPRGQVSYHVPNKWLDVIGPKIIQDQNYKWDGHTSAQVLERLAP